MAKVASPGLPLVAVIVKVPVERAELLEVVAVSCTCSTSFPLSLLVRPVVFQVPPATIKLVGPPGDPSVSRIPDRKRVKLPLPVTVLLLLTEPLPSSNNQSLPPDCRSTTTRLNVWPVGGGV